MRLNQARILRESAYLAALLLTGAAGQWLTLGRINPAMLLAVGALAVVIRVVLRGSPAPPGSS
jgi:hypothetical protein